MSSTPSLRADKKHWWLTNKKVVERRICEARCLIATQQPSDVYAALALLDTALAVSPRHEAGLEMKARCLLYLRKFRDVADMLQDYIPSFRAVSDEDDSFTSLSSATSSSSNKEQVKLLPDGNAPEEEDHKFWCFSVSELKRKVLEGIGKSPQKEGHWRYIVLGQACCHLGMMEDAMVLLQTGRRLAAVAFRRESHDMHDDNFLSQPTVDVLSTTASLHAPPPSELENAANLLNHIKFLLRRRAAAVASLHADLPAESIRHYSKILDSRRGVPHAFATTCFIGRAAAFRAAGRLAEAVADCNRALALDPTSIPAMRARADLLETIRSLPDCLRDLDHLKLLYDAILRDRKLPGPVWRSHHGIRYRDIPGDLRALTERIRELRQMVAKGEGWSVDYYSLIGVKKGCTRSELDRTHLLLSLKHRPDKATAFVERLEFADEHGDLDTVRDQARMSALILFRLLQKGHSYIMSNVLDDEAAERQRLKEAAAAAAIAKPQVVPSIRLTEKPKLEKEKSVTKQKEPISVPSAAPVAVSVFQGVFCRDLAVVGSMLSQAGFSQAIPVKYEALSC